MTRTTTRSSTSWSTGASLRRRLEGDINNNNVVIALVKVEEELKERRVTRASLRR